MNWKELMRMATLTLVAMFAFAACSSDDDDKNEPTPDPTPVVTVEDAKLVTFGFYQEDNAGVLSKDYVAEVPAVVSGTTTYNIEIAMPSVVDKSELVARFTVNDGNTITVGSEAQVSKETKNDFTAPVDYSVSNSDKSQNLRYTVTVIKSSNMAWTALAELDPTALSGNAELTGVYSGAVLAVNEKDDMPYVAFGARGVDNKLTVAKNVDGAWSLVGSALFSTIVNGSHFDFDITPDGTPYVAYGDQDAESLKGALSVMKFDGSKWNFVGDQGFFKVQAQYVGMAAAGNGVAIDLINNSASGDIARRAMGVATYDGAAWTSGESALLASGQGVYMTKMGGNGKVATLISINRGAVDGVNYGHNIFKYENGQWEALATNFLEEGATQTSIAQGSFGTTVAPDGTVYAWTGDDAPGTTKVYQVRLKKYDATSKTWSTVAGNTLPIGHDNGFESHISLNVAIAPDGTPFVAYNNFNDQKKLYVMYLDSDTKQWTAPVQLAEGASDVNIKFSSTGVGYITYTDESNHIHLYKYTEQ